MSAHVNALDFYGGVPEIVVPDNLRSGVNKSHRYEPDVNATYQEMVTHYGTAIIPSHICWLLIQHWEELLHVSDGSRECSFKPE